ncbi:M15 family metallopeptidase [Bacillus sp. FSL W7-1360]
MNKLICTSMLTVVLLSACGSGAAPAPQPNGEIPKKRQEVRSEAPKGNDGEDLMLEAAFFTKVTEVDGELVIENPENMVVKVNQEARLPKDYQPDDLVKVDVPSIYEEEEGHLLREEAARALEQLFAAAEGEHHQLYAVSGFRTFASQKELYDREVEKQGKDQDLAAVPGHSEHQTGLAIDIATNGPTAGFGSSPEGIWVAENAHHYGFVIRYPEGKEEITGYRYEPWHLRYVGEKVANDLIKYDYTLEEYFKHVTKK